VYGSIDQDVWRRDFTCNALCYDIEDFSIWDYVGGVEDVRARTFRRRTPMHGRALHAAATERPFIRTIRSLRPSHFYS